jgi:Ceramidase
MIGPLLQDHAYHAFADERVLLGVANGANTLSNLAFLAVGALGLLVLGRRQPACVSSGQEARAYHVLFTALLLTGLGSAYYHLAPSDARLAWDRLPMAVAFMSLLCAVIAERLSVVAGVRLLAPLLLVGAASVVYWSLFGDLWPYVAVQAGSLLAVVVLCLLYRSRYTRGGAFLAAAVLYGLAKLFELYDRELYEFTGHWLSGHTAKHLLAALAVYLVVWSLEHRAGHDGSVSPPSSAHRKR